MIPLHRRPEFFPTSVSLAIHAALIVLCMGIPVSRPEAPAEDLLHFSVKSVDTRPLLLKHTSPATNPASRLSSRRFIKPAAPDQPKVMRDVPVNALIEREPEPEDDREDVTPKAVELYDKDEDRPQDMRSVLIHTEEKQMRDRVEVRQRSTEDGPSEILKMMQAHKTDAAQLVQSFASALKKVTGAETGSVDLDPEEGMPGFTPVEGTFGNAAYDQGGGLGESRGEILKYESLDEFLDIRVSTYQDPKDSQKYFMIQIFTRPEARSFQVMPKEILFLIDCSLSISPERLDEFKRGISHCLKNLNKKDVFNIIAFRDRAFFFQPKSVRVNDSVIKEAERFVSGLTSNRTTDVYGAFQKIVQSTPARSPSNIILISDGRPTHGIRDSRELINSVTRLNKGVRPIFAYSGGAKVNRYLLDFLAYQNRAWSQYVKERGQIHTGLAEFYSKIKDPVFLDLRYRLNGLEETGVYPKALPDFYRNAEFTLYGTYTSEDTFSMQLLGDVEQETKELVFTRSLSEAGKGGSEIMKGYAFNRIYHLISRHTSEGNDPKLLKEIQDLGKRYGVTTPYSPDLETKD